MHIRVWQALLQSLPNIFYIDCHIYTLPNTLISLGISYLTPMLQVRKLRLGRLKWLFQEYPEEPVQPDFQTLQLPLKVMLYLHPLLPMPHVSSFQKEDTQEELISEPNKNGLVVRLPSLVALWDANCTYCYSDSILLLHCNLVKRGSQIFTECEVSGDTSGSLPWLKCTRVHFSFLKAG